MRDPAPPWRLQVAVIAKEPVPGRVKTRLCPPCTPEQAAALAAAMLDDVLAAVAEVPDIRRVLLLDGARVPPLPGGFEVLRQRGRTIGRRLGNGFCDLLGSRPAPTLIISSDTPSIAPAHLEDAAERLTDPSRAVIGACLDGGYWSIGMAIPEPAVFDGVAMSTPLAAAQQRARLTACGFTGHDLTMLRDIDRFDDALAVAAQLPGSRTGQLVRATAAEVSDRS